MHTVGAITLQGQVSPVLHFYTLHGEAMDASHLLFLSYAFNSLMSHETNFPANHQVLNILQSALSSFLLKN